ncbi:hypothetical protein COCON_G00151570 [Conger conger]|uniref:Glycine N-acyltransferase-like protein n=1 Tax=Conger conger TaxID=82655 RepID=A0A9Q1D8Z0_CONCO|nr:hypothetical protein COCON_G00151570 [Conger conger]
MKILNKAVLQQAEKVLQSHLPKSFMVYGYLFGMNRNRPHTLEFVVDCWPNFKTIICRPHPKIENSLLYTKELTFFSTDEKDLKRMLMEDNVLDWNKYFKIGGIDIRHGTMLKAISAAKGVTLRQGTIDHILELQDPSLLPQLKLSRDVEARISSLNESHVGLVNKTWKFGEYRERGYAKILTYTMAARLHAQGFPMYCSIEEGNQVSYRLVKKMGLTEDPSFRATCYEFNY